MEAIDRSRSAPGEAGGYAYKLGLLWLERDEGVWQLSRLKQVPDLF